VRIILILVLFIVTAKTHQVDLFQVSDKEIIQPSQYTRLDCYPTRPWNATVLDDVTVNEHQTHYSSPSWGTEIGSMDARMSAASDGTKKSLSNSGLRVFPIALIVSMLSL
jgi:hypothetical protein